MATVIHFVYAVPDYRLMLWQRACRKIHLDIERWISGPTPRWRHGAVSHWPTSAPASITHHVYKYLRERCPVLLYDLRERIKPRVGVDDVVLGHPWIDPGTIVQRLVMEGTRCRAKILMFPYHHGLTKYVEPARPLVERCDQVLGITGQYWYDTMDASPFASWKPKFHRLDMAIDAVGFPFVKSGFNPPGKRKYLFIGSDSDYKGLDTLARIMARLPGYECGWLGPGRDIPYIRHVAQWADFTPEFVRAIAQTYDFYVHTGISDANPTTILEAMAWGFPVACTPQSGYYHIPSVVELSLDDLEFSAQQLLKLQFMPVEDLQSLSQENRQLVETHYTWKRFNKTVWRVLEPYIRNSGAYK